MSSLDLFIVNLAFPYIGQDYPGTSLSSLSWVLNAYTIVFAAVLVPAGRWADRIGRRRALVGGLAAVHRRLGAVRAGARGGRADRGPGHPGGRGRHDGARVAVPAARRGAAAARPKALGHLVGARRAGRGARPGDRRQPGPAQLALGVLDQRAGRARGRSCWPPGWCRRAGTSAPRPARPARRGAARAGGRPGRAGAGQGARLGLGLGRRSWACWPPRWPAAAAMVVRSRRHHSPGDRAGTAPLADVQRRVRRVDPVLRGVRGVRAQLGGVPDRRVALLGGGGRPGHRARAADGAAVRPAGRAAAGRAARRPGPGRGHRLPGQRGRRSCSGWRGSRSSRPT